MQTGHRNMGLPAMLLAIALGAGCAGKSTITTTVTAQDGTVTVTEQEITEAQGYHQAQVALAGHQAQAMAGRKPLWELTAQDGQAIELKGVKSIAVYGPPSKEEAMAGRVRQWENQALKVGKEILFAATAGAVVIRQSDNMKEIAVNGIENAGHNTSIGGSQVGGNQADGGGTYVGGDGNWSSHNQDNDTTNTTTTQTTTGAEE